MIAPVSQSLPSWCEHPACPMKGTRYRLVKRPSTSMGQAN